MAEVSAGSEQVEEEFNAVAPAAVANATPLGLFALALTLFILSLVNAGILADTGFAIVIGLAFFLGGVVLLVAGIVEFRGGNTFTGTVFTSYSALWLSFGFILLPGTGVFAVLSKETMVAPALGYYLLAWTIYTALLTICVLRTNVVLLSLLVLLVLTLGSLTIYFLSGASSSTFQTIGGYIGIITSIVAWYLGLAGILPYSNPRISLPVFPLS
jgi:succinate-acetate transporter protein